MELHRGRLIDHIQLRCADLAACKRFYATVLAVLGRELVELAAATRSAPSIVITPVAPPHA
jgi:catechol 2,3-dioxygenase-like lactoylglutathione lyase family enzyme